MRENPPVNDVINLLDDFQPEGEEEIEIPYGQPLFYRLVALREINYTDPAGDEVQEFVPSLPTKVLLTNVVDNVNPSPPVITPTYQEIENDSQQVSELQQLKLSWTKTTYNGKYYLYKMNSTGNWNKLFEIQTNNPAYLMHVFAESIPKLDEDGETIYHRFKVSVENSSGLLNLTENIITI